VSRQDIIKEGFARKGLVYPVTSNETLPEPCEQGEGPAPLLLRVSQEG